MVLARPTEPHPQLSWWGWGDPEQVPDLPAEVLALLSQGLGVTSSRPRPSSPALIPLTPPRLAPALVAQLDQLVGSDYATSDHETRLRHALGRSTADLLRLHTGVPLPAPDLVLAPESHEQIARLLQIASAQRIALTPFGGGTSVVGGLTPETERFQGWVALDLRRLDALVALDEEARVAVLQPLRLRGPQAEGLLADRGYTIGHFPQSFQYATMGGFAAARSSGQASAGYGCFDELVLGLRVATPAGTLTLGRAPRSAAGPDLRQLMLGSEGALGVITELSVAVRPTPHERIYEGWRLPSFSQGAVVLRRLVQDGPVPTVARLSDETETALNLSRPGELGRGAAGGCLTILGYEGPAGATRRRADAAATVLRDAGGEGDPAAGEAWERERYEGPYLRDALLEAGALVETLETATFWSTLESLYTAVGAALREALSAQGTPPVILCHISHVYPAGASLYFTVGCASLADPLTQWSAAKAAPSDAILAAGGSISHHPAWGVTTCGGMNRRSARWAWRRCARSRPSLIPRASSTPGS